MAFEHINAEFRLTEAAFPRLSRTVVILQYIRQISQSAVRTGLTRVQRVLMLGLFRVFDEFAADTFVEVLHAVGLVSGEDLGEH